MTDFENTEAERRNTGQKRWRVHLVHENGDEKDLNVDAFSAAEAREIAEDLDDDDGWQAVSASRQMGDRSKLLHDGHGRTPGHRPGFIFGDSSIWAQDAKGIARAEYLDDLTNAWRVTDAGPEGPEGASCTVRNADYPLDFGSPGHIKNGVCVPDKPRRGDAAMREVYQEYESSLCDAWRAGDPQAAAHTPRATIIQQRPDGIPLNKILDFKERIMNDAYSEYDAALKAAYRNNT